MPPLRAIDRPKRISRQKREFSCLVALAHLASLLMRFLATFGLLVFLASFTPAFAQVSVQAQMADERSGFLLYERVDMLITVTNTTESDLVLENGEGHPWLSFVICKHNGLPVRPERQAFFKPLNLKVGESKTLRVNLTPLFSFRDEGDYTAQAVVELPGAGDLVSQQVPFSVQRGRQVWSQQRPIEGSQRVYSLIRFAQKPDLTELYLRVEDPAQNTIYANIGLGPIEAFIDPQAYFDPQGNVHVLQLISMSTYLYTRADADGKVMHQGVFKTFQEIPPRLRKMDDGSIYVAGGIEETPQTARESLLAGQKSAHGNGDTPPSVPANISAGPAGANTPISLPGQTPAVPSPSTSLGAQPDTH
jgi:hypothetical protein